MTDKIWRILAADEILAEGLALLRQTPGVQVDDLRLSRPELAARLDDYDALIVRSGTPVDRQLIERGSRLRVEVTTTEAKYHVLDGSPLRVSHHGQEILLPVNEAVTRSIPPIKAGPRPTQPPGRAPVAREARAQSTKTPT